MKLKKIKKIVKKEKWSINMNKISIKKLKQIFKIKYQSNNNFFKIKISK